MISRLQIYQTRITVIIVSYLSRKYLQKVIYEILVTWCDVYNRVFERRLVELVVAYLLSLPRTKFYPLF